MKMLLAATTALVSGASLAIAGSLRTREPEFSRQGMDANQTFLCDYGFTIGTKAYVGESSGGEGWIRAATPVWGKGETVSEIIVEDTRTSSGFGGSTKAGFTVAIYSSHNKKPDQELVTAYANKPKKCERVKLAVSPIQLEKGKKFWIVETAAAPSLSNSYSSSAINLISWIYDKKHTQGGLWQSGYSDFGDSCYRHPKRCHHETHWMPITGGLPYARLISKAQDGDDNADRTGQFRTDNGDSRPPDAESGDRVQSRSNAMPNRGPP